MAGSVSQPITAETPDWLKQNIIGQQIIQNRKNDELLERWLAQGREWVENSVRIREAGGQVAPFTIPMPKRIIIYDSGFGYPLQGEVDHVGPKPPVLPPPVATTPSGVLGTQAGERDQAIFEQFSIINGKLDQLLRR